MEIIPFGSQDIDNILSREPQRAEYLPFGAVLLDRMGKILKYNMYNRPMRKRVFRSFVWRVIRC